MSTRVGSFNQSRQSLFSNAHNTLGRSARMVMSYIGNTTRHWYRNHKTRAQLARLPDYILKDIGLRKADAIREVSKPFWMK